MYVCVSFSVPIAVPFPVWPRANSKPNRGLRQRLNKQGKPNKQKNNFTFHFAGGKGAKREAGGTGCSSNKKSTKVLTCFCERAHMMLNAPHKYVCPVRALGGCNPSLCTSNILTILSAAATYGCESSRWSTLMMAPSAAGCTLRLLKKKRESPSIWRTGKRAGKMKGRRENRWGWR